MPGKLTTGILKPETIGSTVARGSQSSFNVIMSRFSSSIVSMHALTSELLCGNGRKKIVIRLHDSSTVTLCGTICLHTVKVISDD